MKGITSVAKHGLAAMALFANVWGHTAIAAEPTSAQSDAKRQEMIKIYQFGLSKADDKNWALLLANTAERLGLDEHRAAHYLSYLAYKNNDINTLLQLRDDFARADNRAAIFKLDRHLEALLCSTGSYKDSDDLSEERVSDSALKTESMLNLPKLSQAACEPELHLARIEHLQESLAGRGDLASSAQPINVGPNKAQWRELAWLNRPAYLALQEGLVAQGLIDLTQAPLSFRLDYAFATKNHQQLRQIITGRDAKKLSPQQKIYLYAELGYFATAKALARAEIETKLEPAEHASLLSTLSWLEYRHTPHLLGLNLSYNSGLSRESAGFFYHAPLGEARVLFELDHERFDVRERHSRQDWQLALKGRERALSYALSLHGDTDENEARFGQSVSLDYQHNSTVTLSAGAENDAPILFNQRWRLAGMQDQFYLAASFNLYSDWRLNTRVDHFDYQSRKQALSLDFYQLNAGLEHKLANTRDTWLYLNTTWQSDIDSLPANAVQPGLDLDYQLAQANLDPYRRVAIGLRKAQAITPELALLGPFNWHLDASLGYLSEAKEFGVSIASSARWRLTDSQIIELSLEHQAQAREGGETNALSLTYYLDLDGL